MKKNNLITGLLIAIVISGCIQNKPKKDTKENQFMSIIKEVFGTVENKEVSLFTLKTGSGFTVQITNYGGIVTSILAPDKNGKFENVVLGYDNLAGYLTETPYFGAIVGRYANRIAKGKFVLDGQEYTLAVNNGTNHLHGGIKGFDKVVWDAEEFQTEKEAGIKLNYLSVNGEEGYPGNLAVKIIYTLTSENELKIEYTAVSDKATPINLSHHSYFNLGGTSGRDILNQILFIDADYYTVVDETLIPTGELRDVTGAMDFRMPVTVESRISEVAGGYDHNYVLNNKGKFAKVAELSDSISGRKVEVYTDEPGLQFYSGNFLDGSITGSNGIVYRKHHGLCLETQHFPDSPNHPEFPTTILRPGEEYRQKTVYKFKLTP
jgi:aldose 1-epimerase